VDGTTTRAHLGINRPSEDSLQLELAGSWILGDGIPEISECTDQIEMLPALRIISFDSSRLDDWDNGLLVFLRHLKTHCSEQDITLDEGGLPEGARGLLNLATAVPVRDTGGEVEDNSMLSRIGSASIEVARISGDTLGFLGEVVLSFGRLFRGRARFRKADLGLLIQDAGAQALPIVTLINTLIGVIMAFVGAVQLQQFGAEIFVADLVAIAMVREMGPMMTAIIVAGRSGAAYAAELGTMTVNEEIDALRTSGFSPIDYLVLPRLLALGLMMPLLTVYADFMGMLGGLAVGVGVLDISWSAYLEQTKSAVSIEHFTVGIVKAMIYGHLVALAGCLNGIRSGRNASAVGAATTSAVVYGIVLIIAASAVTTIIFSIIGI